MQRRVEDPVHALLETPQPKFAVVLAALDRELFDADTQDVFSGHGEVASPQSVQHELWVFRVSATVSFIRITINPRDSPPAVRKGTPVVRHVAEDELGGQVDVMARVPSDKPGRRDDVVVHEDHDLPARRLDARLARRPCAAIREVEDDQPPVRSSSLRQPLDRPVARPVNGDNQFSQARFAQEGVDEHCEPVTAREGGSHHGYARQSPFLSVGQIGYGLYNHVETGTVAPLRASSSTARRLSGLGIRATAVGRECSDGRAHAPHLLLDGIMAPVLRKTLSPVVRRMRLRPRTPPLIDGLDVSGFTPEQRKAIERDLALLDPADRTIVRHALPYTMTGIPRLTALIDAVRHLVQRDVAGAFVECGVWRGGSVLAMLLTLLDLGVTERDVYLYDTFTGMTEPTARDVSRFHVPAIEAWSAAEREGRRAYPELFAPEHFNEAAVRATLQSTGYPTARLHFVVGDVEQTVPAEAPERLALLRLDTDWYESTRHELRHLYPRLHTGGVLIVDDYGEWDGARRAVDEFFATQAKPLLLQRIDHTARMAIKA